MWVTGNLSSKIFHLRRVGLSKKQIQLDDIPEKKLRMTAIEK